jgi:hypothetical protein
MAPSPPDLEYPDLSNTRTADLLANDQKPLDAFPAIDTNFFLLWQYNFAVVGVACVFWKSPLIVKQVYLVIASCIMAWYSYPPSLETSSQQATILPNLT